MTLEQLVIRVLDCASLKSVRDFADSFKDLHVKLDGLVLNAGSICTSLELTEDGIERMFQVNYLSQFALVNDLMSSLAVSASIVSVTSAAHFYSAPLGLDLSSINDPRIFDTWRTYGRSKLACLMMIKQLTRRLGPESLVIANAVHPGFVAGHFTQGFLPNSPFFNALVGTLQSCLAWSPETAALTVLNVSDGQSRHRGGYWVPVARLATPSILSCDEEATTQLWNFSQKLLEGKGHQCPEV